MPKRDDPLLTLQAIDQFIGGASIQQIATNLFKPDGAPIQQIATNRVTPEERVQLRLQVGMSTLLQIVAGQSFENPSPMPFEVALRSLAGRFISSAPSRKRLLRLVAVAFMAGALVCVITARAVQPHNTMSHIEKPSIAASSPAKALSPAPAIKQQLPEKPAASGPPTDAEPLVPRVRKTFLPPPGASRQPPPSIPDPPSTIDYEPRIFLLPNVLVEPAVVPPPPPPAFKAQHQRHDDQRFYEGVLIIEGPNFQFLEPPHRIEGHTEQLQPLCKPRASDCYIRIEGSSGEVIRVKKAAAEAIAALIMRYSKPGQPTSNR